MTHLKEHSEELKKIPEKKRKQKVFSTIVGAVVAVAGFLVPKYLGFPIWFGMILVGFGGWIISKELLKSYLGYIPAALKDFMGAIGKK